MIEGWLAQFEHFPAELKALPNWCIAAPDKSPYYLENGVVMNASATDPKTWKPFEAALHDAVSMNADAVGFMLSHECGYTCIDLDVIDEESQRRKKQKIDPSKWTTEVDRQRYNKIIECFDTYSEVSKSGKGAHLWLRGTVGAGARRDGVEVYSQERFMICTGQMFLDRPVRRNDELLDMLVREVRGANYAGPGALVELEPTEPDSVVWDRAANAANNDKFSALVRGEWKDLYPSQSEADLALMSMFTFYSKSNSQCRKLFRATELGKRTKAIKNDKYLNYTLEVIRGRQAREQIIDREGELLAREFVKSLQKSTFADVAAANIAVNNAPALPVQGTLEWPPGMMGALAKFIYNSSARPVKEISIVTAMGFIAGVVGRAFNINHSGLNMYITLVSRSAVGKEALHSGISLIIAQLREECPAVLGFVNFDELASGPGLKKICQTQNSFVSVSGEWGKRLERLAREDRVDGPMHTLRTEMTNLYQKSGRGNMVGGIAYSNKEQNVGTMTAVAFSLIGESTPETFYRALTPSMMEDGFLSRFVVVAYEGDRPAMHYDRDMVMPPELKQALKGLVQQCSGQNGRDVCVDVEYANDEVAAYMKAFDLECDRRINSTNDESIRQMWNRAHLKAMRIAACTAVFDNWHKPEITMAHAEWAIALIRQDIRMMDSKMKSGDVGSGDDYTRMQRMIVMIREYYEKDKIPEAYGVAPGMKESGIITHRYLQMRSSQISQFKNAKLGVKRAFEDSIRMLIDNGHIQEVPKDTLAEKFTYFGKSYRVLSLPPKD